MKTIITQYGNVALATLMVGLSISILVLGTFVGISGDKQQGVKRLLGEDAIFTSTLPRDNSSRLSNVSAPPTGMKLLCKQALYVGEKAELNRIFVAIDSEGGIEQIRCISVQDENGQDALESEKVKLEEEGIMVTEEGRYEFTIQTISPKPLKKKFCLYCVKR